MTFHLVKKIASVLNDPGTRCASIRKTWCADLSANAHCVLKSGLATAFVPVLSVWLKIPQCAAAPAVTNTVFWQVVRERDGQNLLQNWISPPSAKTEKIMILKSFGKINPNWSPTWCDQRGHVWMQVGQAGPTWPCTNPNQSRWK